MNDTNQLPVLTHHELPGTRPTQSTQSAIALSDVIGSFDFFLCLYLPPISAQSIGHCPISILGAKLIEGQFTTLLNNSQWHFIPRESIEPDISFCLKMQNYVQSFRPHQFNNKSKNTTQQLFTFFFKYILIFYILKSCSLSPCLKGKPIKRRCSQMFELVYPKHMV